MSKTPLHFSLYLRYCSLEFTDVQNTKESVPYKISLASNILFCVTI